MAMDKGIGWSEELPCVHGEFLVTRA